MHVFLSRLLFLLGISKSTILCDQKSRFSKQLDGRIDRGPEARVRCVAIDAVSYTHLLTPLITDTLGAAITPLFTAIGVDPGMFGSILANDMGGYPLAMELAIDERAGLLGGAIVASMFGVILVFHIPVGLGLIPKGKHPWFAQGLLIGFIAVSYTHLDVYKRQVPSCWQMLGYDRHQYTNIRYPFPFDPPYVPEDNPCGAYVTDFTLDTPDKVTELHFEGVDSCLSLIHI